jgi:hypothetical protein
MAHQLRERDMPKASQERRPEACVTSPLTWLKRRGTYTPVCRGRIAIPSVDSSEQDNEN